MADGAKAFGHSAEFDKFAVSGNRLAPCPHPIQRKKKYAMELNSKTLAGLIAASLTKESGFESKYLHIRR
eukprot:1369166-Amorphochlora_amoeboformis.AAC.1